jgi:X-Pro dipeptidyl-peptidase
VQLPWLDSERITDNVITRGWADPQNHASLERSEPLVPGRSYDLAFELQPDDQVVAAGRRIALMVFASDRDFTLWPAAGTELTIDLGATSLALPVVGGLAAFKAATGDGR